MAEYELPPIEFLRERFCCDFQTGKIVWKKRRVSDFKNGNVKAAGCWNTKYGGKEATIDENGYRQFRLTYEGAERKVMAHRIIWALWTGKSVFPELDHVNGNALDNRPSNLRPATRSQNNANRGSWTKTGLPKGVTKIGNKYRASAAAGGGKTKHLGHYATPEEAHRVATAFMRERHGEFHRTLDAPPQRA